LLKTKKEGRKEKAQKKLKLKTHASLDMEGRCIGRLKRF
jgi:hypothetical protein